MSKTSIQQLNDFGQSIWLDNINRSMLKGKRLKELIDLGLRGMTSNPTIFDKTVSSSQDYDDNIEELSSQGKSTFQIYDHLTVRDVQDAADIFQRVYKETEGKDGYVSLEVNPHLAFKAGATIEDAKRLYKKVNRPNVMFKIPATDAGLEAIESLLSEGININVTLIFSLGQYIKTAQAFLKGIKRFSDIGGDLKRIGSVASVFVSRIDTVVDKMLDERIINEADTFPGTSESTKNRLSSLRGKAAVANSVLIFQKYKEIFSQEAFGQLQAEGAGVQRVLWGSTSSKNPAYSDIKYVSELIGRETVNTIPEVTLKAFLDHGVVKEALTPDGKEAQMIIDRLAEYGIDVNIICANLLRDGVDAFRKSFDSLLKTIGQKSKTLAGNGPIKRIR